MVIKKKTSVGVFLLVTIVSLLALLAGSCENANNDGPVASFRQLVPAYIKDSVYLSSGNPFSMDKARLGRYFFYDRRMSLNQSKSCSSCHDPAFSFTDGYRRSTGSLGDQVQHNAPALINIVFDKYLTAADSTLHFPEQQINNPLFHQQPVELGWAGHESSILERLKKDSFYYNSLRRLFPGDREPFCTKNIQACISSFIKTILSFNSPYDRYRYRKDSTALTAGQLNGGRLFFSDRLHCSACHGGINFSIPVVKDKYGQADYYQNTGLYNINDSGAYPVSDQGLYTYTRRAADMGKFRIASLRNLAFTAPYLHDGTAPDLSAVIDLYAAGGRPISGTPNRGDGRLNPFKSPLITGFILSKQEKKDLVSFLLSLSDTTVCRSPAYGNPFIKDETKP